MIFQKLLFIIDHFVCACVCGGGGGCVGFGFGGRSEATSETRHVEVVQSTIPTDNPTFEITTVKLDGHNHLAQSPS